MMMQSSGEIAPRECGATSASCLTIESGEYDRRVARMSVAISGITMGQVPHIVEPVIGRAFARPVGLYGLQFNSSRTA